jgi:heat shock protein HspQ
MKRELNKMVQMYKSGIHTDMYAIPKYTIQGTCEGYEVFYAETVGRAKIQLKYQLNYAEEPLLLVPHKIIEDKNRICNEYEKKIQTQKYGDLDKLQKKYSDDDPFWDEFFDLVSDAEKEKVWYDLVMEGVEDVLQEYVEENGIEEEDLPLIRDRRILER